MKVYKAQLTTLFMLDYIAIAVCEPYLMMANRKCEIYRWFFKDSLNYATLIPNSEKAAVNKIFINQKGYHAIITLSNKDNKFGYYFNIKSQKIKELFKIKELGISIESIAWDEKCSDASTNVRFTL